MSSQNAPNKQHKPPPLAVNAPVEVVVDDSFLFSPGVETPGHRLPEDKEKAARDKQQLIERAMHSNDSPDKKPGCKILACCRKG